MTERAPSEGLRLPEPIEIARLEERRQAFGVGEIAHAAEPAMGGTLCAGEPGSWLNMARGIGLDAPVTEAEVDRLVSFYRDRGMEPTAEICPFVDGSLLEGLASRGFLLRAFATCWASDCAGGTLSPVNGWASGVRFEVLDTGDRSAVEEWVRVSNSGFVEPEDDPDGPGNMAKIDAMRRVALHPRVVCVGAYVGDELAGAGAMEVASPTGGDQVAGLFAASVLEPFRGRGIQQGLICERLRIAHERGASVACIESKPGIATERNARRLGFQPAYTKATLNQPGAGLVPSL